MRQILLQNATAILLQKAKEVYTKFVRFFIIKCDVYYKSQQWNLLTSGTHFVQILLAVKISIKVVGIFFTK